MKFPNYQRGDTVTFKTGIREWDLAHRVWVSFSYAHQSGVIWSINPKTLSIKVKSHIINVPYSYIVN